MRGLVLLPLLLASCATQTVAPEEQEALEQAFEESMRDVALVGNFTVFPRQGDESPPPEGGEGVRLRGERYEIEKVVKRAGDLWTFHARIQFGDKDVTLPVPVRLTWSGDTPMLSVTDLGLPGLGTYTARVVFYRDGYAGMWWGKTHGGNMFGRIVKNE